MQTIALQHIAAALVVAILATALALTTVQAFAADADLAILTFPVGLVVGEHEFEVDLGASRAPAEMRLDGHRVCSLGGDDDRCTVDLGSDLKVHLLELERRDATGSVTASARRWVNRPGQEAELSFRFAPRDPVGVCSGRVLWLHPDKQSPSLLLIQHNGRSLHIHEDGRSFAYPCADPTSPNLVTASAIFPDGRRAEAVSLTGGFGGHEGVAMTAVPVVDGNEETAGCAGLESLNDTTVQSFEDAGFEIVFVLDPAAGYQGLLSTAGRRNSAWRRADASLWDADRIWIVMPDEILSRMDAYGSNSEKGYRSTSGKPDWLSHLFSAASVPFKGDLRFADAVAASGLVAAAGPRRRAIVLILGDHGDRDTSVFNPTQARAYLEEIGVSLHVLRIGRIHDDGWPEGVRVLTMPDFATSLEALRRRVDQQCIAWFRGDLEFGEIAARLPEGTTIAGTQ